MARVRQGVRGRILLREILRPEPGREDYADVVSFHLYIRTGDYASNRGPEVNLILNRGVGRKAKAVRAQDGSLRRNQDRQSTLEYTGMYHSVLDTGQLLAIYDNRRISIKGYLRLRRPEAEADPLSGRGDSRQQLLGDGREADRGPTEDSPDSGALRDKPGG